MAPDAPDGAAAAGVQPPPPPSKMSKRALSELALVGVCLFWGTSFIIVKRAFENTSPLLFSGLRFLCGLLTLLPIYARQLRREYLRGALIVGVLLFCGFSTQAAGLNRTTPTRSAFITALCIPLTPIFQSALYRRKPRALDLLGAFVAATGTFLLTSGGGSGDATAADGTSGGGSALNAGDWLTLLCAVLFAFHMIALNHWGKGDALPTIAVGQVLVTMVLSLAFCDVFETAVLRPTFAVFAAIVVTGTLCTALAFTVLAWAQTHTSATRAAIICSTGAAWCCLLSRGTFFTRWPASQRACLPRFSRTCLTARRFPGWVVLARC